LKVKSAKTLASQLKNNSWEAVTFNYYHISCLGYNFYKRKISPNYWQFTVLDDITSCTFKMYMKER